MRVARLFSLIILLCGRVIAETPEHQLISNSGGLADFGGNGDSGAPALSANGRYVAFVSGSANLVAGVGKQPVSDIYLHDRETGSTRLISRSKDGTTGADLHCWNPQMSTSGLTVLFETYASNLVDSSTNGASAVMVYNAVSNLLIHASVGLNGAKPSAASWNALLSQNGRMAAFESGATNLTTGIVYRTTGSTHIFARDLQTARTELIDVDFSNGEAARASTSVSSSIVGVSTNGTMIAFISDATNLTQTASTGFQLWVRDRTLSTNILVSRITNQPSSSMVLSASMSADGRKFVFRNGTSNFFRDITAANSVAMRVPNVVRDTTISPDGQIVAYIASQKLSIGRVTDSVFVELPQYIDATQPVFSRDSSTLVVESLFEDPFETNVTVAGHDLKIKAIFSSSVPSVSRDGAAVGIDWFTATNRFQNVFVEESGTTTLISAGLTGNVAATQPTQGPEDVSTDGRTVLFTSLAALVPEDENRSQDVYLWDDVLKTNLLVSRTFDAANSGSASSFMPAITPDGQQVAFVSAATNIVQGDTNWSTDVFVWNRINGSIRLVSESGTGLSSAPTVLACTWPVISKDGRYVAFVSRRKDLVKGTIRNEGVYLRDLENNVTLPTYPSNVTSATWFRTIAVLNGPVVYYLEKTNLFSFNVSTRAIAGYSNCVVDPVFSADEKRMAMLSRVSGVTTLNVYETATAARRQLYRYPGTQPLSMEHRISMSGDGKRVAFVTAERLVDEDRNGTNDVYIAEVDQPGAFRLVRPDEARAALAVRTAFPSISADGTRVSFVSKGNAWSPFVPTLESRVYLVDLPLRKSQALTPVANPYFGGGYGPPLMLPNGSGVVFGTKEQFAAADLNRASDSYYVAFPFAPMIDVDRDELADEWEIAEFGNLTETTDGDADGDGQSNLLEYRAGTDPTSADSSLSLEIAEVNGAVQLHWKTVPGKNYEVQHKINLESEWNPLTESFAVENGIARISIAELQQEGFFRIRLKE